MPADRKGAWIEAVNNLLYRFEQSGTRVMIQAMPDCKLQVVNNVYVNPIKKDAPAIDVIPDGKDKLPQDLSEVQVYLAGNISSKKVVPTGDDWDLARTDGFSQKQIDSMKAHSILFNSPGTVIIPTEKVRDSLLNGAGASLPKRDDVDRRVIKFINNNSGEIIQTEDDVGGYPPL